MAGHVNATSSPVMGAVRPVDCDLINEIAAVVGLLVRVNLDGPGGHKVVAVALGHVSGGTSFSSDHLN
jgi:hypothetical protein